jgi:predicted Zn-dependent protease with MMP-like domain
MAVMWTSAKAPSLAEMETMAHEILAGLPQTFRDLCEGVIVRVEDFPTDEVLDEMEAETTGPSTTRRWGTSFAMCWSTRSGIISASPTRT